MVILPPSSPGPLRTELEALLLRGAAGAAGVPAAGAAAAGAEARGAAAEDEPLGPAAADPVAPCPDDMVWVEGSYCTEVKQLCVEWLDDPKLPYARCATYQVPVECVGQREPMSFCIDRFEYTRPGDPTPVNQMSFALASKLCQGLGKRLCTESEWNFACEGEAMLPYPYGYQRAPKCNQDRTELREMALVDGKLKEVLKDHRRPSSLASECVSPFGVFDLVGNLDEPVLREATRFSPPYRNALKGGWWMAARNRCRPATTAHDDYYQGVQVGVRCCSDVPDRAASTH